MPAVLPKGMDDSADQQLDAIQTQIVLELQAIQKTLVEL